MALWRVWWLSRAFSQNLPIFQPFNGHANMTSPSKIAAEVLALANRSIDNDAGLIKFQAEDAIILCNAVLSFTAALDQAKAENDRLRTLIQRGLDYGFTNGGNWHAMKSVTAHEARAALAPGDKP
jgi:hypothetical protein